MKLQEYINTKLLKEMIDMGYVTVVSHPCRPLRILSYSKTCTIDHVWNEVTMKCRGLVIDDKDNIVARPFEKFFNYEELEGQGIVPPEGLPFEIYEKMDGSLGILFWYRGQWIICTKGSFTSDQAEHAQELFNKKYLEQAQIDLDPKKTYLFEIIYPEDIHVVTYRKEDDIYLLAVFDTETAEEENIYNYSSLFKCTKHFKDYDWKNIRTLFDENNKEGFVVRFSNGFRMKIKFDYYFRLHALKCSLTEKKIFEDLSGDNPGEIYNLIQQFPEETQIWYKEIVDKFCKEYDTVLKESRIYFDNRPSWCLTGERLDRESAEYYKSAPYPSIAFMLAKDKDTSLIRCAVWNEVSKML